MPNQSFPVVTHAVWNQEQPSQILDQLRAKAIEMQADGKTDNVPEFSLSTENRNVSRRNWADTAAANEWISFVEETCGDLISIAVES